MIKFVEVKEIPDKRLRKNVSAYLEEFVNSNVKVAQVSFDKKDYVNANSAQCTFYKAAKRGGYPVTLATRNGELYIINNSI